MIAEPALFGIYNMEGTQLLRSPGYMANQDQLKHLAKFRKEMPTTREKKELNGIINMAMKLPCQHSFESPNTWTKEEVA